MQSKRHRAPTRALHASLAAAGLLALVVAARAQDGARDGAQDVARTERSPIRAESVPEPVHETVAGGPVTLVPLGDRDDAVPLPTPPVIEAGPDGDRVIAPASGDPHFLGFAAGSYYPPAGQRLDPLLVEQIARLGSDGRESDETYAFVMFSKRMTRERAALLESFGARLLGRHPWYTQKVAVPASSVQAIADLDFVRWIGVPREWQKVHPALTAVLQQATNDEPVDVYVTSYESDLGAASAFELIGTAAEISPAELTPLIASPDAQAKRWMSNGWRQAALETEGLEISSYHEPITAFRARVRPSDLVDVTGLDFVQFVELDVPKMLAHDESMPMVNADFTRVTDDGNTFGDVVAGVIDTGIENSHTTLNHIYGIGVDFGAPGTPWDDGSGHGSHVSGTVFGDPSSDHSLEGAAPDLGWHAARRIFNAKVFDDNGNWTGVSLTDLFNWIHTDYTDSNNNTTPKPHVTNNSWGAPPFPNTPWVGSEADARTVDNEVYLFSQMHIFAAGNSGPGPGTVWLEGVAKNALTVGNVTHYNTSVGEPGNLWTSSSRGPCADNRWKPNLVAPGTGIESVDAATSSGTTTKTGTSMATPHVTGVAAQLTDRYDFLQYNTPTLAAVLMAGAMQKDNTLLSTPSATHLDTYGTGRLEAYRSKGGNSQQAMYFWGFLGDDVNATVLDFDVLQGATRLTVVMAYHEIAASSGANVALVNDIDMYLDPFPFTSTNNSGDYFAQQSSRDNTEIRVLNNPTVGAWKIKCYPDNVGGFFSPKVGVCAIVSYGDITPNGVLSTTPSDVYVTPGEQFDIDVNLWNPSYVASAVWLDLLPSPGYAIHAASTTLKDGSVSDLSDNSSNGKRMTLGNISHGQSRQASWTLSFATEGQKSVQVQLNSENMDFEQNGMQITVDGTPPSGPTNLSSPSHTVGLNTCDGSFQTTWSSATDALSGVAGYSIAWSNNAAGIPDDVVDLAAGVTSYQQQLTPNGLPWYFHIKALDLAGNVGATQHLGPFLLGEATVTSYCTATPNSTAFPAWIEAFGTTCLASESLTLRALQLPSNQFGHFYMSQNQGFVPLFGNSQGNLCVAGPIYRFSQNVLNSGSQGIVSFSPDFQNLPQGVVFLPGSTWRFQFWFRDQNPNLTSNTTDGLKIVWD